MIKKKMIEDDSEYNINPKMERELRKNNEKNIRKKEKIPWEGEFSLRSDL